MWGVRCGVWGVTQYRAAPTYLAAQLCAVFSVTYAYAEEWSAVASFAGIDSAVWSASAVATVSCGLMSTDPFSNASAAP